MEWSTIERGYELMRNQPPDGPCGDSWATCPACEMDTRVDPDCGYMEEEGDYALLEGETCDHCGWALHKAFVAAEWGQCPQCQHWYDAEDAWCSECDREVGTNA